MGHADTTNGIGSSPADRYPGRGRGKARAAPPAYRVRDPPVRYDEIVLRPGAVPGVLQVTGGCPRFQQASLGQPAARWSTPTPLITRSRVDLPAPLGTTGPVRPAGIVNERSSNAGVSSGEEKDRFETTMDASDMRETSYVMRARRGRPAESEKDRWNDGMATAAALLRACLLPILPGSPGDVVRQRPCLVSLFLITRGSAA